MQSIYCNRARPRCKIVTYQFSATFRLVVLRVRNRYESSTDHDANIHVLSLYKIKNFLSPEFVSATLQQSVLLLSIQFSTFSLLWLLRGPL